MKRALRWIARIVGAVIVILIVAVWFALSSERVAQWAVRTGLAHAPPGLQVGEVRGRLRGPLVLNAIAYRSAAMSVSIDSVLVDWRLSHLVLRQLQLDRLHVVGMRVVLPDSAAPDTAKPSARTRPHLPVDVRMGDVAIRNLSVRRGADLSLHLDSARMTGRAADYRFSVGGNVSASKIHAALQLHGSGSMEQLALDSSQTAVLDGNIYARGKVGWWPAVNWDVDARAAAIRPGLLMADTNSWPGAIALRLKTRGTLDSTGLTGNVAMDSLSGMLRRQPLTGQARLRLSPTIYHVDTLSLGWGSVTLAATGMVGDSLGLHYQLAASNLGTVSPGASGSFALSGTASGLRRQPHIRAEGRGNRIASGGTRIARATLHADVDAVPGGRIDISLRGDSATISQQAVPRLGLDVSGTREAHHLNVQVRSARGNLRLAAHGGFDGTRWLGRVDTLNADSTTRGNWRLRHTAAVLVSSALVRLDTLCLEAADSIGTHDSTAARACVAGSKSSLEWHAVADIQQLPLTWLPFTPGSADSLVGSISAQGDVTGRGQRLTGTMALRTDDAALLYHEPGDKKTHRIALDSAAVHAEIGAAGLLATLGLRVTDGAARELAVLSGQVSMPRVSGLGPGMAHAAIDAQATGRADNLAFLRPFVSGVDSLGGAVNMKVTVAGTADAPHIDGELHLQQLVAALPQQRSLRGSADLTLNATPRHGRGADDKIELVPHDMRYSYRELGREHWLAMDGSGLVFASDGTGGHGTLNLTVNSDRGRRAASLTGTLELPEYAGATPLTHQPLTVNVATDIDDLGIFQSFTAQVDSLAGRFKLQLDMSGRLNAPTVTAKATVDSLRALLPFGTMVRGGMASELHLAVAAGNALSGQFTLAPKALTLEYRENGSVQRVSLDSSSIVGAAGADGVKGAVNLVVADQGATLGELHGTVALPHYSHVGRPIRQEVIEGALNGKVTDLRFIKAFTPLVDSATGNLALDARVTGTAGDSRTVGSFQVHQTAVRLPRLGILLDQVELTAQGDQAGAVTVNASMHSGQGAMTLAGTSPVKPTAAQPGRVHIEGKNFEAANSAQLRAIVSPQIDVTLTDQTMQVRGQVEVPIARLVLAQIPETAIAPSDDVVLIDSVSAVSKGPGLDTDVRVILGDSVSFSGFNFNATLSGALRVMQQPRQLATASGGVVIDSGTYKAYGQDLTISQGKIQFAGGPIDNPALNIRAARTADSVVAGLDIKGTLKTPEVTIFSEPSMSQTEALSYIATGHGIGQGSGSSGNLISKALSALGLRGGNAVAGVLGHELHLDEARIQTEGDIKKASFVAGTYLSPNVYISYGIGLFDPVSTLRLRYMVSNHFTLQAETGQATGADALIKTTKNEE